MGPKGLSRSLKVFAESFMKEAIYFKSPLERVAKGDSKQKKQSLERLNGQGRRRESLCLSSSSVEILAEDQRTHSPTGTLRSSLSSRSLLAHPGAQAEFLNPSITY